LRLRLLAIASLLFFLILPTFLLQVKSGTSTNTLFAHAETTTIGGVSYYLHKLGSADGPATTLSASAASVGRKLMGRWVYSLNGIISIPASTWTVTYRAMRSASATSVVAHCDVNISIRKSDNTIRATIAANVANSPSITLTNAWQTLTGTYNWPGYTVVDQTDYLEVAYCIEVTTAQSSKYVRLLVDDGTLPLADQTKVENVMFAYPNQAPVASFTYSPVEPRAEQTVTFNASASYDPDGNIISYQWDFGDANVTTVTDPIITHVYVDCGNYTVTLTVTDNESVASSTSQSITVINPSLLRLWADVGSYVGSHPDAWIHESWVASSDLPAGSSVSFNLSVDAVSNLCGADPTYDVYLAVAVNDTAQVASITIGSTTVNTFTNGEVSWPSVAGGGTLSPHGVYPTWYALASFGNVSSNHAYYTTPGNPYGPYWAYRAYITVTITTSATMNAGFKVHFDAQGVLVRGSTKPGHRNTNSFSHDLTSTSTYIPSVTTEVTFAQVGVGTDFDGIVLTVDGVDYSVTVLPQTFTWVVGSEHTFEYHSPLDVDVDKRYIWTHTTGLSTARNGTVIVPSGGGTVTGYYKTQYKVTFNQTGLDDNATGIVVTVAGAPKTYIELPFTTDWLDHDSSLAFEYSDTVASSVSGKRFKLLSVSHTTPLTVTAPTTVTGNYKTQYQITVTATPSGAIGGTFKVTYIQCGTTYTNVQRTTPWTEWVDASTNVTVSEPQDIIDVSSDTRYKFDYYDPSDSILMTEARTLTLVYKTQYLVSFTQIGSAVAPTVTYTADTDPVGTVPFGVWVRAGTEITYIYQDIVEGASGVRYVLTDVTPASSQIVNGPLTIIGTYKTQYLVTFTQNGLDDTAIGTIVTVNDTAITVLPYEIWVNESSWITYSYSDIVGSTTSGKRFKLVDVTGPASPFHVTGPVTVKGEYKIQYQITVTASPAGALGRTFKVTYIQCGTTYTNVEKTTPWTEWVDASTNVTVSEPQDIISISPDTRYKFDHYDPSNSVHMDQARTVTLVYKTQYYLTVTSSYGTAGGHGWYDSGATAYATLNTGIIDQGNGTRRIFTGWGGDASGSNYTKSNPISMSEPKTAIANWKTQYLLTVLTDPAGLSPQPTRNPAGEAGPANGWWYDASTNVTLTAQSVAGYTFNYWKVDGVSQGSGINPVTVKMSAPHTATAHYSEVQVGGYSISLAKQTPAFLIAAYAMLIALFSAVLSLTRRKRK